MSILPFENKTYKNLDLQREQDLRRLLREFQNLFKDLDGIFTSRSVPVSKEDEHLESVEDFQIVEDSLF